MGPHLHESTFYLRNEVIELLLLKEAYCRAPKPGGRREGQVYTRSVCREGAACEVLPEGIGGEVPFGAGEGKGLDWMHDTKMLTRRIT